MKGLTENNLNIAVKIIDTRVQSEYVRRFLPREAALVKNLRHDCVLRVYQVVEISHYTIFVTEFCDGGDLLQKIKKMKRVPEPEAKLLFRQLIEALIYLQKCDIVHRDLKCENVFLDRYENVKLGDFGFARYLKPHEKANTFCGSRAYVAPEILRAIAYTGQTIDIWSAGVVLYVMVTGVMPYDDRNPQKMVERQLGHKIRFPKIELSIQVKTLIYEILHPYPPSRPTYKAICSSDWLKQTSYTLKGDMRGKKRKGSKSPCPTSLFTTKHYTVVTQS
ncbi:kinase domain protein [Ostertagia ostertagi]